MQFVSTQQNREPPTSRIASAPTTSKSSMGRHQIDFSKGLLPSRGHNVIMVVVDRFSKYGYFLSLSHSYTSVGITRLFMDNIFKLLRMPQTIVSDRDPIFMSQYWKEIFWISGTEVLMSSAYHPQTNSQIEVMKKGLEYYLGFFSGDRPRDWVCWLSLVEWSYNTSTHTSTQLRPFEVVYGPPTTMPPSL